MTWRFIPFRRYDPYIKTGLNDAAMRSARDNTETVWLAGWDRPCINVGRSQRVRDEVDLERAREDGITVLRRQGGGGTTYLAPDGEVTWGMTMEAEKAPDTFEDLYRDVCGTLVEALGTIGIEARYETINDVVTANGKISGATARKDDGAVYVGGTLLYTVDPETMFRYLSPDEADNEDEVIERFKERVTSVADESDAGRERTIEAIQNAFLTEKDWETADWTADEMEYARKRAERYRSDDWLFMHE